MMTANLRSGYTVIESAITGNFCSVVTMMRRRFSMAVEIFCERENGTKEPFDLYSMEDAINEGFILNPMQAVMSFKRYYKLMRNEEIEDKEHDRKKTVALLSSYIDIQPAAPR